MSMIEIDKAYTKKANATRVSVNTILKCNTNKYVEHLPNKTPTAGVQDKQI